MATYKNYVLTSYIAPREEIAKTPVATYAILGTPTEGYRATANYEGVDLYMAKLVEAYGFRRNAPVEGDFVPRTN
jgi:hypothetical protein